jgi:serine/threonine-protein kinase
VLAQAPDPGGRVRKGSAVALVVSRGPDRRVVPASVVGATQQAATSALTDLGLRAGAVTQEFAAAAVGTVLRTDPTPGTSLRPDTAVALVVSKGVEPLPIPDVRKRPQAQAQAQLQAAGFSTTVQQAFDEQVPAGTVLDQSPQGIAGRGATVTLTVSKGPDLQVVPQLLNTSRTDAEAQLSALGLTTQVILLPAGPGTVRRIDPGAGTRVRKGTSVTLFVF